MTCRALNGVGRVHRWSEPNSLASCFRTQHRHFTSSRTNQKNKPVPTFSDASSPELEDLLSKIRTNLFLPAYLTKKHKKLVFSTKSKRSLEDDPIDVQISGETFRLRHLDRTKDMPQGPLMAKVLKLMATNKDWDNLPPLLEGIYTMKESVGKPQAKLLRNIFTIIRKASLAGRQDVLLECARRVSETGFELKDFHVVREIMWQIQYKALSHDWSPAQTKKAFGNAQQLANLLDDERHSSGNRITGPTDPRARPEVIGILLELAAVQAKISGSEEDRLNVEVYARRLLAVLPDGFNLDEYDDQSEGDAGAPVHTLRFSSTILYGMREASKVLGPASEEAELLNQKSNELARLVKSVSDLAMQSPGDAKSLGRWTYQKLFPSGI